MSFIQGLFSDAFVIRWLHIWFGIIWIGTLYYFNFMQVPFMGAAETEAATKSRMIRTMVPRALWWFRWAAMLVFLTGLYLWDHRYRQGLTGGVYWETGGSLPITIGILLGTLMFLNVWLIIWPKQKIVIANAVATAEGKAADPAAAAAAARAGVASRTNTLFSIPMLFFMVSAAHYPYSANTDEPNMLYAMVIFSTLFILAIQANAMWGKMIKPLASVKAVVWSGFALWAILYVMTRLGSY